MYTLLLGLVLALHARPTSRPHVGTAADTLTCTLIGGPGAARRCSVAIPAKREVIACSNADRSAHRCASGWGMAHTAWVTRSRGAQCKISAKHSDWRTKVTLRMSKKSAKTRGATCALHVAVR
jgi:hypothetical protein